MLATRVCLCYQLPRRAFSTSVMSTGLPSSPIPLLTTAAAFREWRNHAFRESKSVGYVPTMGALHDGHLSLVRRCLAENDLTVLSIFVNPAQFAPHEDLTTYPRTLPQDIAALVAISVDLGLPPVRANGVTDSNIDGHSTRPIIRKPSAIFLPSTKEMYPSGISQDVSTQKGTFVEIKGYSHQMEGKSRPTFFRGVMTVVTKLFNVVQPTRAYFGQKDIQQALLIKRLTRDLLISHPLPEAVRIMPTARDPTDGLALSSRNAYLSSDERKVASTLYQALTTAKDAWDVGLTKAECLAKAFRVVESRMKQAQEEKLNVEMRLDFIEFNDAETFEVVEDGCSRMDLDVALLSGALIVGKTRLIDNIVLGDDTKILG